MAHMVICPICKEKFDRDKVQAVKYSARRYAHQTCYMQGELVPLGEEADPELVKLKDYINELYGDKAHWATINKQIKKYKEENGYSYSGIMKSLIYFYQVKKKPIEKSNYALGIVPYVYQDAYTYYYNLFMAQQANENKTLLTRIKEIVIKPPQQKNPKKRFFNLGDEEDG